MGDPRTPPSRWIGTIFEGRGVTSSRIAVESACLLSYHDKIDKSLTPGVGVHFCLEPKRTDGDIRRDPVSEVF